MDFETSHLRISSTTTLCSVHIAAERTINLQFPFFFLLFLLLTLGFLFSSSKRRPSMLKIKVFESCCKKSHSLTTLRWDRFVRFSSTVMKMCCIEVLFYWGGKYKILGFCCSVTEPWSSALLLATGLGENLHNRVQNSREKTALVGTQQDALLLITCNSRIARWSVVGWLMSRNCCCCSLTE